MPAPGYRNAVLGAMPNTRPNIAAKGVSISTVGRWLKILREEKPAACHIGAWKRANGGGSIQPIWHAGPGKDAVCRLKCLPNVAYGRKYRASIKDTERGDLRQAKRRASVLTKRRKSQQNWTSPLGLVTN